MSNNATRDQTKARSTSPGARRSHPTSATAQPKPCPRRPSRDGAYSAPAAQPRSRVKHSLPENPNQTIKKHPLTTHQFPPGRLDPEPLNPIDLRKLPHPPRPTRPLHLERPRHNQPRIEIPLHSENHHNLPPGLLSLTQRGEVAIRHRQPQLLKKLPPSSHHVILPRLNLPLGNRPSPIVLPSPKRTTHMSDQHLNRTTGPAKHQNPRTTHAGESDTPYRNGNGTPRSASGRDPKIRRSASRSPHH